MNSCSLRPGNTWPGTWVTFGIILGTVRSKLRVLDSLRTLQLVKRRYETARPSCDGLRVIRWLRIVSESFRMFSLMAYIRVL